MTSYPESQPSTPAAESKNAAHHSIWDILLDSAGTLEKAEERREQRLLSTLLIFLILQAILGVIFVLIADTSVPPLRNPFLYVAIVTIQSFVVAYWLSRSSRYRLGAAIVIASLPVFIYAAVLTISSSTASRTELLIWLVMAILIGSMFFPVKVMSAYTVASLCIVLSLPIVSPDITYHSILVPFIFIAILSTMVLVWARHRNLVERDRQTELAESEMRYRTLLETSFDGIIFHDSETLFEANTGFARMFGYEVEEVRGMPLSAFAVPDSGNRAIAQAILEGVKQVHETRGVRRDGTVFDIEVVGRVQPWRGRLVQMTAVRDISERKRAESAERNQRLLAEALRDTAALLTSTLDLDEVFDRILTNIGHVVPHDAANIMLIDGSEVHVVRCTGYEERGLGELMRSFRVSLDELPLLPQMLVTGEPVAVPYIDHEMRWAERDSQPWIRSYVGAPIRLEGKVIGFINLDSATPGFFTQTHAEHLKTFADQSAVAIHNARLYRELETYSERLEQAVRERTAELSRTKERVEAILNNSPDAILLLSTEGLIRVGNPAFSQMFGYHIDDVFNQHPSLLVTEFCAKRLTAAVSAVITDCRARRLELTAQRRDGSTFDVDIALAPISEHNTIDGVVCSLRDISALKEVERMKDAFVSNVSHELRTPITNLKLYQKMLALNQRPEKHADYLNTLERETQRLSRIIEDLLQLSRLDQQRNMLTTEPVDLNRLVQQHVIDRRLFAEAQQVHLSAEQLADVPPIPADEGLLGQVLSILLTNAINYTPPGGKVCIATHAREAAGKLWVGFTVSDTGPGIPEEEQPHVFERFFRGKTGMESGAPGTGLGLAIAKSIVEQYQGEIGFECREAPETGTTFSVWLPLDGDK